MNATRPLFSTAIQPSTISLFSSTGSDPLALFSVSTDKSLPADSFVHFLHDRLSIPAPASPNTLLRLPDLDKRDDTDSTVRGRELEQTVLHMQSPTLPTTYIQCPPITPRPGSSARSTVLGIKHPWMYIQVRNLSREWAFEVGVVDQAGRMGVIRFSVFQKKPRLKTRPGAPPLLLLPLSFPAHTAHLLSAWSTITVHLPSLLPHFSSPHLLAPDKPAHPNQHQHPDHSPRIRWASQSHSPIDSALGPQGPAGTGTALPAGTFACVSYVRVYASCRLRRIWFGEGGPAQKVPWEFELYAFE